MSLKIVKIEPRNGRIALIAAAILCLAATFFFIRWNFANAVASRLDFGQPESKEIAAWLTDIAPADPQTHFAAAHVLEKTFDPGDLAAAVVEYETAAALSPHHYLMWLNLGKARTLNGDAVEAEAAYDRALLLAPNYSAVQWVFGNFLIRQSRNEKGFAMMAKAAAANSEYSASAVATALQIFDGDVMQVRKALGDSDVTNTSLADALAGDSRFDEAVEAWSRISKNNGFSNFKTLGDKLVKQLAEAKKFQMAARVSSDVRAGLGEKPVIGQFTNGGFEGGVQLRNASLFEWQIGEGSQPQIGLVESQPHGGSYSLLLMFNSMDTAGFRSVLQTVAAVPSADYEFEVFYRSDLKTAAIMKWEIVDAANSVIIGSTPPIGPAAEWRSLKVSFSVPNGSDGVLFRLTREGCSGLTCPANGRLTFDDFSLRRL